MHGALTAVHALPSSVAENVDPSTHALHTRSATAEPACDSPWPAAHVCHATQAWLPGAALNMPLAHGAHSRSAVAVGAFDWPKPTAHVRHAVHLALPALLLNWPAAHLGQEPGESAPQSLGLGVKSRRTRNDREKNRFHRWR